MCGRFTLSSGQQEIADSFPLFDVPALEPRYNIAPTQSVATARTLPDGKREVALLHWGLIPSWADDPAIGNRLIDARADTVATKPSFRSAFKKRRCLIPADGFFEWQPTKGSKKQPYHIRMKTGKPFGFAGLWEHWERDGQVIESAAIITTDANDTIKPVHNRMPVILAPGDFDRWLDPVNQKAEGLGELLRPFPVEAMQAVAVSLHVNNPRNDDPRCIEPLVAGSDVSSSL